MITSSDRGGTLIEVMIGAAIASIVSVVMAQIISNSSSQQRILSARMERLDLETGISTQMSLPGLCTCNFAKAIFGTDAAALKKGWAFPKLGAFNQDCTDSHPLVTALDKVPGTQTNLGVGQTMFTDGFKVSNDVYTFTLHVPYIFSGFSLHDSVIQNVNFKVKASGGIAQVVGCGSQTLPDVIPNAKYNVTCTALSGATQSWTSTGMTGSNVLTKMAPSGQGYWAVAVNGTAITDSHNCFADQVASGNTESNVPLCTNNGYSGRSCAAYGTCTYANGKANPFANCSFQPQ